MEMEAAILLYGLGLNRERESASGHFRLSRQSVAVSSSRYTFVASVMRVPMNENE